MIRKLLDLLAGKPFCERSPKWPEVRNSHLVIQPVCQACKGTKDLNVHHIKPVHLFPELELDRDNLITLCEANQCHFMIGHGRDWKAYNVNVIEDANHIKQLINNRKYK